MTEMQVQGGEIYKIYRNVFSGEYCLLCYSFFLFCENCDIDKVFKRLPLLVSNYIRTFIFKKRKALKPSNSKILSLNEFRILPISLNL